MHKTLRKWHIWLGWIAGIPLLLWTVSGFVMIARPLAEVRSETVLRKAAALPAGPLVAPREVPQGMTGLVLVGGPSGPRWRIGLEGGRTAAADARTGLPLQRLNAAEASAAAAARYTGKARLAAVRFIPHDKRPAELSRDTDSWQLRYDDGLRLYVDAWSGEVVAARSGWWRIYDFFWGLHIMDLETRDNPHNPWMVTFALITLMTLLMAFVLLPRSTLRLLRSGAGKPRD